MSVRRVLRLVVTDETLGQLDWAVSSLLRHHGSVLPADLVEVANTIRGARIGASCPLLSAPVLNDVDSDAGLADGGRRLTTTQLAELWNVSPRTIRRWTAEGMPVVRLGRSVRYRLSDVDVWERARDREPA